MPDGFFDIPDGFFDIPDGFFDIPDDFFDLPNDFFGVLDIFCPLPLVLYPYRRGFTPSDMGLTPFDGGLTHWRAYRYADKDSAGLLEIVAFRNQPLVCFFCLAPFLPDPQTWAGFPQTWGHLFFDRLTEHFS